MSSPNDLEKRLDLATGSAMPRVWDRQITEAMRERRRRHLENRTAAPGTGTELIAQRLAAARADRDHSGREPAVEPDSGPTLDLT